MVGGLGSGRIRTLSDEERKKRGTYREETSEAAALARAAEKIVAGPWLPKIPEPEMPLNEVGKGKYLQIAQLLFDQNKLTQVTCDMCLTYAALFQSAHARMAAGKTISADMAKRMDAILQKLRVAENAPTIAAPSRNRFDSIPSANSRFAPIRLRPHSSDRGGKS
jgi:hypothetical protein